MSLNWYGRDMDPSEVGRVPAQRSGYLSDARIYPLVTGFWGEKKGYWSGTSLMPRFIALVARLWGKEVWDLIYWVQGATQGT